MQSATRADVVNFKEFEHGILYSLYFKHANRKQHGTVERSIERLDAMLKKRNVPEKPHFTSLTETGKVKSFRGRDRHGDYHFCEIFNVSASKIQDGRWYQLQPGVASFPAPSREQAFEGVSCQSTSSRDLRREDALASRLQIWWRMQQLPMLWSRRNRENPEADRIQCGSYRVDFTYECDDQRIVLLLELDEHAHRSYSLDCELKRQLTVAMGFSTRPVRFIRYNPDGGEEGACLALLLERMQAALEPAPSDDSHLVYFLTIEYLFYPRIEEGGNDGPLQIFRFETIEAYEQWMVLRTTSMPLLGQAVLSYTNGSTVVTAADSVSARTQMPEVHGVLDSDALLARLARMEEEVCALNQVRTDTSSDDDDSEDAASIVASAKALITTVDGMLADAATWD